ncbi:NAD-dependent epimerase/dehydratase family protein [Indiicoccus explosivorum]|uniref:NAD-dependent epimerase/dehydratase family protein n=1 Tax=Indiicoccus explosivorum TaxID=1917864 RepID=UPI000B437C2B|nr:NAD-dependent epimerase/dehydratase family protein [Indiicoccus explosivorum]
MKILILGGTSFVGRHITAEAASRGHSVTLFNRGKSHPDAFPDLPRIKGDRRTDAKKLAKEEWDAVIDVSAYTPADLDPVLRNIRTGHYTFISTISVYESFARGPVTEESPVHTERPQTDEVTGETYGPLKVMCEERIAEKFGSQALVIRPGIVAGPFDPTDRFTYWAVKLAEDGPLPVPGSRDRQIQWIDARDLARFTVEQTEKKTAGMFNVAADPMKMETFTQQVGTGAASLVWVPDDSLTEEGVQPFEIPLWIPESPDYPEGFLLTDNSKAKRHGAVFTPVNKTGEDTREWFRSEGRLLKTGISTEREQRLLAEGRKR